MAEPTFNLFKAADEVKVICEEMQTEMRAEIEAGNTVPEQAIHVCLMRIYEAGFNKGIAIATGKAVD